ETGASTARAQSSGMRSSAMATKVSAAIAICQARPFNGCAILIPTAMTSPVAAADTPFVAPRTASIAANCAYVAARARTIRNGISISPSDAASDPERPRKRLPTMIETLTMFGPGRNCDSESTSMNSRSLSQRRCSTSIRRANGSTPPKPCMPTIRKPTNSARREGGTAAGPGAATFALTMLSSAIGRSVRAHGRGEAPRRRALRLQRPVQEGQADFHPVIDVGMIVVVLLVGVRNARLRQPRRQDPRAVVNVVLVAPSAIDVDAGERFEVGIVLRDQIDRVLRQPLLPARGDQLAGFQIERQAETERGLRIGIIGSGHAQVHDRVSFRGRELLGFPDVLEEALYPPVVAAVGKMRAPAFAQRVVAAGLALDRTESRQVIQRIRPIVPIDEIEIRIARMIGDRAPVLGVLHAVDDRAVAAGRFTEATAVLAAVQRAELAVDERNQLPRQI